jgi:hypothetical protein
MSKHLNFSAMPYFSFHRILCVFHSIAQCSELLLGALKPYYNFKIGVISVTAWRVGSWILHSSHGIQAQPFFLQIKPKYRAVGWYALTSTALSLQESQDIDLQLPHTNLHYCKHYYHHVQILILLDCSKKKIHGSIAASTTVNGKVVLAWNVEPQKCCLFSILGISGFIVSFSPSSLRPILMKDHYGIMWTVNEIPLWDENSFLITYGETRIDTVKPFSRFIFLSLTDKLKILYKLHDRLCGLVVRVLGYRSGGPGSIPGTTRKKK